MILSFIKEKLFIEHSPVYNFGTIVGRHAILLCEITQADRKDSKKGLMTLSVDLYKINEEWCDRVCYNETDDKSEFCQIVHKLIHAYSDCIVDYILQRQGTPEWKTRIEYIVKKETEFFNILGSNDIKFVWYEYTSILLEMIDSFGKSYFDNVAGKAVKTGVFLGSWLDESLCKRNKRK